MTGFGEYPVLFFPEENMLGRNIYCCLEKYGYPVVSVGESAATKIILRCMTHPCADLYGLDEIFLQSKKLMLEP